MGKILDRPELRGGATVNGEEVIDENGNWKKGVQAPAGSIGAEELATDAVETAKIKDLNVTAGKLANTLDLSGKSVTLAESDKKAAEAIPSLTVKYNADPESNLDAVPVYAGGPFEAVMLNSMAILVAAIDDFALLEDSEGGNVALADEKALGDPVTTTAVHNADPASNLAATALYVVINPDTGTGYLSSVTNGNATSSFELSDGSTISVIDDDGVASNPLAFPVYIDEDGEDKLIAGINGFSVRDGVYVRSNEGGYLFIKSGDTAGGVQLYFDDDGGTATEKLAFVSPTTANATLSTADAFEVMDEIDDFMAVQVYFDENATDGARFLHGEESAPATFYLLNSLGNVYTVTYSATAATKPALYVDPDAASADEMLFAANVSTEDSQQLASNYKVFETIKAAS